MGAACLRIESRNVASPQWTDIAWALGNATTAAISPKQLPTPGTYCFRVLAANRAASSDYSNESCIEFAGGSLTYPSGWNLVASGATDEEVGYWVYFDEPTTLEPPIRSPLPLTVDLPPSMFVLIGNPSSADPVIVQGADVIYAYDATSAQYQQVTTLEPTQGAWAYSAAGGALTLFPAGS